MNKGNCFYVSLILTICVFIGGCAGRGDAGNGYYRDDSIEDAGLDGIMDINRKGKNGESIDPVMTQCAGTWYEQNRRRAVIWIEDNVLEYNAEGNWKLNVRHSGKVTGRQEADGTYRLSFEKENLFFTDILYDSKDDIIAAKDRDGNESIFKRAKHVPDAEELKKDAEVYPAPDESFCGYWIGSSGESERTIDAVLERHEKGLRLVVLECGASILHPGDWVDFKRLGE